MSASSSFCIVAGSRFGIRSGFQLVVVVLLALGSFSFFNIYQLLKPPPVTHSLYHFFFLLSPVYSLVLILTRYWFLAGCDQLELISPTHLSDRISFFSPHYQNHQFIQIVKGKIGSDKCWCLFLVFLLPSFFFLIKKKKSSSSVQSAHHFVYVRLFAT